MKQKQDENCFSNLARKMIQVTDEEPEINMVKKSRQIDVANKVRKSYQQLAFKEKAKETSVEPIRKGVCTNSTSSNRYLSVGFHQRQMTTQDQYTEASTNGENTSHGATFKKSGDASSFTHISSEF